MVSVEPAATASDSTMSNTAVVSLYSLIKDLHHRNSIYYNKLKGKKGVNAEAATGTVRSVIRTAMKKCIETASHDAADVPPTSTTSTTTTTTETQPTLPTPQHSTVPSSSSSSSSSSPSPPSCHHMEQKRYIRKVQALRSQAVEEEAEEHEESDFLVHTYQVLSAIVHAVASSSYAVSPSTSPVSAPSTNASNITASENVPVEAILNDADRDPMQCAEKKTQGDTESVKSTEVVDTDQRQEDIETAYVSGMRPLQYLELPEGKELSEYHYRSAAGNADSSSVVKRRVKRIAQEHAGFSCGSPNDSNNTSSSSSSGKLHKSTQSALPLSYASSVWVLSDSTRMDTMQVRDSPEKPQRDPREIECYVCVCSNYRKYITITKFHRNPACKLNVPCCVVHLLSQAMCCPLAVTGYDKWATGFSLCKWIILV